MPKQIYAFVVRSNDSYILSVQPTREKAEEVWRYHYPSPHYGDPGEANIKWEKVWVRERGGVVVAYRTKEFAERRISPLSAW